MCTTSRPRILIADDHVLVAEAIEKLLSLEFEVVCAVHDGRSLMQAVEKHMPDVVLADISMPVLNGLHAAERIKRQFPNIKLIHVTVTNDIEIMTEALERGADGYVLKSSAPDELVTAIRCALRGEQYISHAFTQPKAAPPPIVEPAPAAPPAPDVQANGECLHSQLTDRQLDILQLLAEGRSMKEVAGVLNLTTRTVAFHKYRVMQRLKLKNNSQIVQYAVEHHIIAA
jgi:DNA-binding NarL/FixJ family response regulator